MGLDMFLKKSKYYGEYLNKGERPKVKGFEKCKSIDVAGEVMYWRKANAIHSWFVENTQEGRDECQDTYVPKEKLQELLEIVTEVLKDHKKAAGLLPVKTGFFFGTQEYDDWYFKDLEYTKQGLTELLNDELVDKYEYYSRSRWS